MSFSKKVSLAISLASACGMVFGPSAAQGNKVDFEKSVWPILEGKCVKCHGAHRDEKGQMAKPKAGLRLDAAWAILAGGDDGKVLSPGDGANSEMWWRTDLDPDNEDIMPPQGKSDPLTPEEKELLKKWIDEGADFGRWEGNLEGKPQEKAPSGGGIRISDLQALYRKLSEGLALPEEETWKSVTAAGGRVQPLEPASPLLAIDFRLVRAKAGDAAIEAAGAIRDHVAQLDASGTSITDAALAAIGEMKRLVRLDLHQTGIGDAGLAHLENLENLRHLNLYGTGVTDAGLKSLEALKDLDKVYLWQSQVTPQGVKRLQKALPDTRIVWE